MFKLRDYTAPDFTKEQFVNAPDARFEAAQKDGVAPENFHAMSIFPEYFKVNGEWLLAEESRMDCVPVLKNGRIHVVEFRNLDKGDLVAFGVSAPSMAKAFKKCKGRLFPFGWIPVLKALNKNDTADMFLIAVRPDLQGKGLNAVILSHLYKLYRKNGIRWLETGPQLETNEKILSQWGDFEKEQHKRRRCFIKDLDKPAEE